MKPLLFAKLSHSRGLLKIAPLWRWLLLVSVACAGVLGFAMASHGAAAAEPQRWQPKDDPDFARFLQEKRNLVKTLARQHELEVPTRLLNFFDATQEGKWATSSNLYTQIKAAKGDVNQDANAMPAELFGPIQETFGAYEQFHAWNPKLLRAFARDISQSVPEGSIYMGGTDAGRFAISCLSRSHNEGRPFFTVTQNQLADLTYLNYVQDLYGSKIHIPEPTDSQAAFQEYLQDAVERQQQGHLDDGEDVRVVDGRVTVSGVLAVMKINTVLTRMLMEQNAHKDFYLEESYPMAALYAQSTPCGLIFRVHHQKVEPLPEDVLTADHRFWAKQMASLVGDVVKAKGTVAELCTWVERVHLRKDLAGFGGSREYLSDQQAPQYYAKCRCAQASFYQWRAQRSRDKEASGRLTGEADLAYRQAVALAPFHSEVVWRYTGFLAEQRRTNDMQLLVSTALKANPTIPEPISSELLTSLRQKLRSLAEELGAPAGKE